MQHFYIYELFPNKKLVKDADKIVIKNEKVHWIKKTEKNKAVPSSGTDSGENANENAAQTDDDFYHLVGLSPIIFDNSLEAKKLQLKTLELADVKIDGVPLIDVHFKYVDSEIREEYYKNGFYLELEDHRQIHFVRYKRSASSARAGTCLFIREDKYAKMEKWSNCGLNPASPLVKKNYIAYEAYKALTLSACENFFDLDPASILILDDVKSEFEAPVYSVTNKSDIKKEDCLLRYSNKSGQDLSVVYSDQETISNTIWDGEGLLDESVFHEICKGIYEKKACCFCATAFLNPVFLTRN